MNICSVPLCGRKHLALGFCSAHYQRHKKGLSMDPEVGFRYLENVEKDRAVMMWIMGKDTAEIAEALKVPESHVYNRLPSWCGRPHDGERPQWRCA